MQNCLRCWQSGCTPILSIPLEFDELKQHNDTAMGTKYFTNSSTAKGMGIRSFKTISYLFDENPALMKENSFITFRLSREDTVT